MSLSILLDEIEPWLLAAVAGSGILLIALIVLFVRSRRKSAKPISFPGPYVEPPISSPGPYVEPPSQKSFIEEIDSDPKRREELKTEPANTYCNNGCQGACACPALAIQKVPNINKPTLTKRPPPPAEDIPPSDPLPEIPKPESQSNLRRRTSKKGSLQSLKEKFVKRESIDAGSESKGSNRGGNKSQGSKRRSSRIAKKREKERLESELDGSGSEQRELKFGKNRGSSGSTKEVNKSGSTKEVNKSGSTKEVNKSGSTKEVNKSGSSNDVNKSGSTKKVNKSGSTKEVNKGGSKKQVNKGGSAREVNKGEHVSQQQSRKDSLKLLKGILSFKKTTSSDGEKIHTAE